MKLFEFHISRRARDAYHFDESLFAFDGRAIFADFAAARAFARAINGGRGPGLSPGVRFRRESSSFDARRLRERPVRAGELNALGLIDEWQHAILGAYRRQKNPRLMSDMIAWLSARIGPEALEATIVRFVDEFPPVAVYKSLTTVAEYLSVETNGVAHKQAALEEMLMVWLANANPAFEPFKELFDDEPLKKDTAYSRIMADLPTFFASQPEFGPGHQNLIDLLRAPALAAPGSLAAQLEFLRRHWGFVLGPLTIRFLRGLDFIREEERSVIAGPGPAPVPTFGPGAQAASLSLFGWPGTASARPEQDPESDPEPERFSLDVDWMPNLVLIAKNIYVWLDQLSKKYGRSITRLDQIPDEELDILRASGLTGLWLIGLWERSPASRRIKQMMGNPEAVASAYSLFDYAIAQDLGGEAALEDLAARARRRGIRLASDMVPNHMGVDSRWVIDHPERFLGLDEPPYPAYSFTGPDLSWDARVGIQIEDHYYDRTDAAVVFKRRDKWTGNVRYLYHGNDGTSYPWNDTAQLNYLRADVREAVIRTILDVARRFPVIRFDAAMTIAKRHFQRLWFPEPGTGGAIPTRAEHGLTKDEFDAAIPVEFWREVVDRVAAEAPDTLLLAEAFWLMEGYFVRTLGMHRVYNSAFMNMLRDEDNAKYRRVMKNTLEFDPEVLRRYVNFMNNPDEKTAFEQFGDGDKYFGVCTLLATLPGLPMVGHGQIEGFAEKYGMEYRRAYYDESPKSWLVDRHAREVFPLFRERHLFAGVEHFLLYDAVRRDGRTDENVFAYSNGRGDARVLVVYHNVYAETRVRIRAAAAFAVKTGSGDEKVLVRKELRDGLRLPNDPAVWIVFKDQRTGLEYIRNSRGLCEDGLSVGLQAYQCHVFMGFREVRDDAAGRYATLAESLGEAGIPNVEEAARDVFSRPVRTPFRNLVNAGFFQWLLDMRATDPDVPLSSLPGDQAEEKARNVVRGLHFALKTEDAEETAVPAAVRSDFEAILRLTILVFRFPKSRSRLYAAAIRDLYSGLGIPVRRSAPPRKKAGSKPPTVPASPPISDRLAWGSLWCWAAVRSLGLARGERDGGLGPGLSPVVHFRRGGSSLDSAAASRTLAVEWGLDRIVAETLREMDVEAGEANEASTAIKALSALQHWHRTGRRAGKAGRVGQRALELAEALLRDADVRTFLRIHEYRGVLYFNKEAFERLMWWLLAAAVVDITADPAIPAEDIPFAVAAAYTIIQTMRKAEAQSGYDVERLLSALIPPPRAPRSLKR